MHTVDVYLSMQYRTNGMDKLLKTEHSNPTYTELATRTENGRCETVVGTKQTFFKK